MNKVYPSAEEALRGVVKDGQLLAVGGFGLRGIPEALIAALRDSGVCPHRPAARHSHAQGKGPSRRV